MSIKIVVNETITQHMKLYAAYTEWLKFIYFSDLVVCDLRAIDDRCRTRPIYLKRSIAVEDDRGIFIDTDSEIIGVVRYSRYQAADAAAFGKVLIDDDVLQEAESW